ncbi:replication factor C subunit RfC3 [Dermatophagoides pteronyssinus]|uniref:Replication factor C (RF-C) subunit n=1 Tax=Dermatophagoides pteronyssinus TaxID=6956 RepID=A0ABQ8JM94_DERPT|nr:Replication factor C (RF-C) subunit [Dermatophagoides pteronyssinus]
MVQVNDNQMDGIHWVEKYRPKTLDDLVSHKDIVTTIEKFINEDRMPHLLLYGPPGTGKTSTILACARKLYKERDYPSMVLELNASDDRGIGIVRGPIQTFASTRLMFNQKAFKLIILDEADAMTQDAQNALRRLIEKYTSNVRFCFICNYLNKIIPAIQSRCTKFRFAPLGSEQIKHRLDYIVEQETINITDDGKNALIELSGGDMRRVLNVLQSTSTAFSIVDEENVYKCCGIPTKPEIKSILQWITEDKFSEIYMKILNLQSENGYSLIDIVRGLHEQVLKIEFPDEIKLDLMDKMADIEVNLCAGGGIEKVQLASLIAAFQCVRDDLKN